MSVHMQQWRSFLINTSTLSFDQKTASYNVWIPSEMERKT